MTRDETRPDITGSHSEAMPVPEAFAALRRDAVSLLSEWIAPTAELASLRRRLLEIAQSDVGCMWREGGPVHFTASLVLLNNDLTHVALTLHRKGKRWFQFGGHFEETDAAVPAAAAREGREESGLESFRLLDGLVQVDAHELSAAFGKRCREHLDLRFAAVADETSLKISDESDDVRWWPLDGLPPDTEPSLHQAIMLSRELARGQ